MSKSTWRLMIHGKNDPYFNMATDEAISKEVANGKVYPTLRFYRWNPATLSLGYFQRFSKEINYENCKKLNIGIVRRITGGRAVLHDDEITYSVSIPSNDPLFEKDLIQSYKLIAEALAEGLKILGLIPSFHQNKLPTEHSSAACFDAPSIYELTVNNKKIIGSAQKRFVNSFLQHGSIPFTINADKLFDCMIFNSIEQKERLKNNFLKKATGINQETSNIITIDNAINAFIEGFEKKLNLNFIREDLTDEEKMLIQNHLYKKYQSKEWLEKY